MPKEDKDMLVVDIDREPNVQETKVDGAGKLNVLSWLTHHTGQIAKGSAALLGLLAFGGLGYYFGRRQSASSSASSVSNALEVAGDFSSALANEATPTPISFIGAAAANKPLDLVYAESAENEDTKIDFGDVEETSLRRGTQQHAHAVSDEKPSTATNAGTTTVKNLVVNGTIPDQLIEVGYNWEGTINMTALFGENATLTQFSSNAWSEDWLQASIKLIPPGVTGFDARGVTVQGGLAYVAADTYNGFRGLKIIDVSNSSNPYEKSSVPGFGASGVTVQGNFAYVACGWNYELKIYDGLKIIDVSDSIDPKVIEPGVSGFYAWSVTVQGNLAYVSYMDFQNAGLKIIDISNSSNPKLISEVTGFSAWSITVSGNLAYVPAAYYGLKIIDVSNSSDPKIIKPGVSGFDASGVTVQGNLAYVAAGIFGGFEGLKIIDLSKWQLSGAPMQSKCTYQFVISSKSLLHGNATKTFTVKTDNFPYVVGNIPSQSLYPKNSLSLAVQLPNVFADEDKEDTLFLSVNSEPQQDWLSFAIKPIFITRRTNFYSSAYGVTVQGNLAYVAALDQGLKIIDVSNSSDPFEKSSVTRFSAFGITVRGNLAYVAATDQGLKIIDVSDSGHPFEKSSVTEFTAWSVTVQGNLAYVAADYPDGLKIIDITDSAHPFVKSGVPGFNAYGVTVQGNLAYVVASYGRGLKIIDISDSTHPKPISGVPGFSASGVTVQGNLAYVAAGIFGGFEGLKIIDISNSSNPFEKSSVTGFSAVGVTVQGGLAYVATGYLKRLKIIDVSKPNKPIIVGELEGVTLRASAVLPANKLCVVGENVFGILDLTNYQFSGVPTEKDVENYNIKVTATDPDGEKAHTNFTIRVEGGPILNHQIPPQILLVGEAANFFVTQGTFSDPNKDVITYEAMLAHGQTLPSFLRFNPSSATFSGTPTSWDKGNYMITIFASDRIVYPPTPVDFTLVVQDPIADQTFIVDRSDSKTLRQIPSDSVFEGRSLVYNVKPRNNEPLPDWLHFDAQNRKLFGTPSAADVGTTSMQITLNDGYGEAFSLFNLRVEFNTPPILASMIPVQYVQAGEDYRFVFGKDTFSDANNDPLRYSADSEKVTSWLKFDPESRTFEGTPSGWTSLTRSYAITIIATDPSDATANGTFVLNLSSWTQFITAGMVIFGALATSYGYTHKKHLLWDFFKKDRYVKPRELLVVGDTEFSHKINFPAEHIKSIIVTTSRDRLCARKMSSCFKKTLGFFPLLESAVSDIKERVFPCGGVSAYLFPWLFYDSKANTLKSIEGGPTEKFIGKDIKIQVRGTDNRIMEEFQIKIVSEQNEIGEIADEADRARRKTRVRPRMVSMTEYKVTELKAPLISPIADIS